MARLPWPHSRIAARRGARIARLSYGITPEGPYCRLRVAAKARGHADTSRAVALATYQALHSRHCVAIKRRSEFSRTVWCIQCGEWNRACPNPVPHAHRHAAGFGPARRLAMAGCAGRNWSSPQTVGSARCRGRNLGAAGVAAGASTSERAQANRRLARLGALVTAFRGFRD